MSKKNKRQIVSKNNSNLVFFTPFRVFLICLFLSFLFYGNSIKNGYSMDDELVTTTDRQTNELAQEGITGIKKIFSSHSFNDGKQNYEYRPVSIYSFAIEWSIMGKKSNEARASFSHFVNVILYAIVGFLLFQLLQVLFQQKSSSLSMAVVVLFMIHPIHSEVVNNLKNRDEILSLLFALLAAIQAFKWIDFKKIQFLIFMIVFIVLSLLSKKSNLPFIVMIPMMIYFFRNISLKIILIIFGVLVLAKIGFNIEKKLILELTDTNSRIHDFYENPLYVMDFWDRIPMYFYSNYFYIQKLFLPYPLSFYYGYNSVPIVGFSDWQFYIGLVLVLFLVIFGLIGLKKRSALSFSVLYLLLALGGISNLLFPMVGIFAERLVFSASIGFCLGIVLLYKIYKPSAFPEFNTPPKAFFLPLVLLIIPSFIFTINRNNVWNSKLSLYENDTKVQPSSTKAFNLLASEYQYKSMDPKNTFDDQMKSIKNSINYYEKSLEIYPEYESSINNIGFLYSQMKFNKLRALKYFKKANEVYKNKHKRWSNQKNSEKIVNLDKPLFTNAILNLANTYADIANCYKLAYESTYEEELNPSIQINPSDYTFSEDFIVAYSVIAMLKKEIENQIFNNSNFNSNPNITGKLIEKAVVFESFNSRLNKIDFAKRVVSLLSKNPNNKKLFKEELRNFCVELFELEIPDKKLNTKNQIIEVSKFYYEKYLDSAHQQYNYLKKELPNSKKEVYRQEQSFSQNMNDWKWFIKIQEEYIQDFPDEFLGAQYVQLGNAYREQKKFDKSVEAFLLGKKEFIKELDKLNREAPPNSSKITTLYIILIVILSFVVLYILLKYFGANYKNLILASVISIGMVLILVISSKSKDPNEQRKILLQRDIDGITNTIRTIKMKN